MTAQKCVVEGCDLEYDVVCSFSFYNANVTSDDETKRQEWIDGAMHEQSECLWRHVSLQLCGYHFELDNQGLWIDSPMLPELLTVQDKPGVTPTADDIKRSANRSSAGFQTLFEKFAFKVSQVAEIVKMDHNYSVDPQTKESQELVSRLNVRQLVDTLGYLSLKNLQRKQLWVVKVETDKAEASITQSEQVITKMQDAKQTIEIVPQTSSSEDQPASEVLQIMDESTIPENFIYEIAEEQEISMEEVREIPSSGNQEWIVNIIPEETKNKYAYIKHCSTGRKKRHFTADMNEITLQGDFENYYILPDVDPSVGVEITTSYEPENYIVEEYQHLVLDERPKKRAKDDTGTKKKRKKMSSSPGDNIKQEPEDWVIENAIAYESDDFDDKKAASRVRRKNKKYLGYDFVT